MFETSLVDCLGDQHHEFHTQFLPTIPYHAAYETSAVRFGSLLKLKLRNEATTLGITDRVKGILFPFHTISKPTIIESN